MAFAEVLGNRFGEDQAGAGTSLYFYARETVGIAQVINGRVHTPISGPGTVAGLPVQSELLGGSGRLESTVSDEAVVSAARKLGILPQSGPNSSIARLRRMAREGDDGRSAGAREILAERARVLGNAVALVRDILNPDDLVVGGQAFTEYPEGMQCVRAAFAEYSLLSAREIRMTTFGNRVQEASASAVSLSSLYADPIVAERRARHRRRYAGAPPA